MNKGERQVKAVRGMFIAWMELFFDVAATDKTTILLPAITGCRRKNSSLLLAAGRISWSQQENFYHGTTGHQP